MSAAGFEFWFSDAHSFGLPLDILVGGDGADTFPKTAKDVLGMDLYKAGPKYAKGNGVSK
ncbi:MAG: hypothetical protein HYT16_00915 [DPANN group archaeon]|nr:hypothetical protein [DPANN group archaeon]